MQAELRLVEAPVTGWHTRVLLHLPPRPSNPPRTMLASCRAAVLLMPTGASSVLHLHIACSHAHCLSQGVQFILTCSEGLELNETRVQVMGVTARSWSNSNRSSL